MSHCFEQQADSSASYLSPVPCWSTPVPTVLPVSCLETPQATSVGLGCRVEHFGHLRPRMAAHSQRYSIDFTVSRGSNPYLWRFRGSCRRWRDGRRGRRRRRGLRHRWRGLDDRRGPRDRDGQRRDRLSSRRGRHTSRQQRLDVILLVAAAVKRPATGDGPSWLHFSGLLAVGRDL